jgi:hypothetical protein
VIDLKAYGRTEADFSRNIIGVDFDVNECGYAEFVFENGQIFVSIGGLSSTRPPTKDVHELPVHSRILEAFVGARLLSISFDDAKYEIQFKGFPPLYGWKEFNEWSEQVYFQLIFTET